MLLIGQFQHTIDTKGRVAIPSEIRNQWNDERDGEAWFAVPWPGGIIRLFTETTYRELAKPAMSGKLTASGNEARIQALVFGLSSRLPLDSAGRIRLPERILERTGIGKDVTLIGCGNRLEIHDRSAWEAAAGDDGGLDELARLLEQMEAD